MYPIKMANSSRRIDGNITIELSVLFPIFCMIAWTFVFYMHGVALEIGMGTAAREGARTYALNHSAPGAELRTQEVLDDFLVKNATIRSESKGGQMKIVVERPYTVYIPFVGEKKYQLCRTFTFHAETLEE